jgi:hypothetical protein
MLATRIFGASIAMTMFVATALAQYETPTAVTDQNRTGPLPYSTSIGSDVEEVDIASGNLAVTIPILSLPGRGMGFNYKLVWQGLFWTPSVRFVSGVPNVSWKFENRPYLSGPGWLKGQNYLSWVRTKDG